MFYIVPLAVLIFGRDVMLVLASFYFRYITLPPPVSRHMLLLPHEVLARATIYCHLKYLCLHVLL